MWPSVSGPTCPHNSYTGCSSCFQETHLVQMSSTREGVSHRPHQPALHLSLNRPPMTSLPSSFSGEEVARPRIREWSHSRIRVPSVEPLSIFPLFLGPSSSGLAIDPFVESQLWRSPGPPLSTVLPIPVTSCARLAVIVLRICIVQLPVALSFQLHMSGDKLDTSKIVQYT
jgi:hypothetical protein